jgi:hypothetical protein
MSSKSCRGRDATKLQEYINDPAKQKKLFAKALENDAFLNSFAGQIEASECIFSYPESEWYGVYLLDPDGNKYFNVGEQRSEMYFFKLVIAPNKKDAFTREGTTDISMTDLVGKSACVINDKGNCVLPPVPKEPKEPKAPKAGRTSGTSGPGPSEPPPAVAQDVLQRLQTLSLNPEEPAGKEQVPREFFEQMKSKMLIVQWMVEKMNPQDLVECIKRGSLSPEDVRRAEAVVQSGEGSVGPGDSGDALEDAALDAAESLPPKEVVKMLKRITKEDLIADLKQKFPDPGQRKEAIIQLCANAGKKLEVRQTKRGPKIFDFNGEQVTDEEALDECAAIEAERIRQRILSRRRTIFRSAASAVRKGKMPAYTQEEPESPPVPQQQVVTPEMIISEINGISDPVERKQAIIELCKPFGYTTKSSKRGAAGLVILDPDEEQITDEDALKEGADLKAASLNSVSGFGKRRPSKKQLAVRKKFKVAAKKCRGRANYKQCMSKALSSFGKKKKYPSKGGRKSPGVSATNFRIGTVKRGLDKNLWVVRKTSNGVKRWIKK